MRGVVYLDKYRLDYFVEGATAVVQFPFPSDAIRDFDAVKPDIFLNQLKGFIQQNALAPASLCIVLSDGALFGKEIPAADQDKMENIAQAFLDVVPFDSVLSIRMVTLEASQVLATNKEMVELVKKGFEESGFTVFSVIPGLVVKDVALETGLTPAVAVTILGRVDSLRQYDFIGSVGVPVMQSGQVVQDQERASTSKRTYVLLGVFVLLIVVLAIVLIVTGTIKLG